jgi:hypothetical protein
MLAASLGACCKLGSRKDDDKGDKAEGDTETKDFVASIAFRPDKHGYPFKNQGGKYPRTPGLVDSNVMVKMFGREACVGGNERACRLTPPAAEWMGMINRAMNGGQCEGMAVSSLTFFKGIDNAGKFKPGAKSAHDLTHAQVAPLIGYYWAFQAVDPVMRDVVTGRRRSTPAQALDTLSTMLKKNELATLAIFAPPPMRGGHAVTPYAIENRGNGVYRVRVYDNNYPNQSRWIEIDKDANTWRYDVAALNPSETKMPWTGDAQTRSIVVMPLSSRLSKAVCPFCRSTQGKKTVMPARSTSLSISDPDGRKVGYGEDGKLVNEIPDAEVVDMAAFLEDSAAPEPMFLLPEDVPYDIKVEASKQAKADEDDDEADEDSTGVAVFGKGTAVALGGMKRGAGESDTLSLTADGQGIKLRTGSGKVPAVRLAMDDDDSGVAVRLGNMKADAGDEVEFKVDRAKGSFQVQGGGKSTAGYDLKVRRVHADADDDVVEEKGVKFKLGEAHSIDLKGGKALAGAKGFKIQRSRFVIKPKAASTEDKPGTPRIGPAGKLGKPGEAPPKSPPVKLGPKTPAPNGQPKVAAPVKK